MLILLLALPSYSYAADHLYDTGWQDYSGNPVFSAAASPYYPTLAYDPSQFSGHGGAYYYKMWYSNGSQIGVAYSNDGWNWSDQGLLSDLTSAHHPWVVYDESGFGGSGIYYKIWYWDTSKSLYGPEAIGYAESTDGVTWTNKQNVFGGTGVSGDWDRGSYGPATIIYNPSASDSGPNPMDYSYVMYYDGTTGSFEEMGLAYSTDGINWNRYGTSAVLPRGGGPWGNTGTWDSSYAYPGTVLYANGKYHCWYSGGQTSNNQGIGYAFSTDGVSWNKSASNPIPSLGGYGPTLGLGAPGSWNEARNYTPAVLYDPLQFGGHGDAYYFKMWRSGRDSGGVKTIGLAFLPEKPADPEPPSPVGFSPIASLILVLAGIAVIFMSRAVYAKRA